MAERGGIKPLVVNIMPHGPAYHYAPDERPDVWWEKSDGSWVGFWKREWPDLLGEAVLRSNDQYTWEVWQPDLRADGCYSATLETGVVHRLFPATERIYRPGIRAVKGIYSETMLSRLAELQRRPAILQLHGFRVPFFSKILRRWVSGDSCRLVVIGHGLARTPISELFGLHRPMTYMCLLVEHWRLRRALTGVDMMSEQTTSALEDLRRVYRGRVERITMGCDFGFWTPPPSDVMRQAARGELGISAGKTVFFASGNYIPRKQFGELVEVFKRLEQCGDWFLLLAGHGDPANTGRLAAEIEPLVKAGKAMMHPYVEGPALRNLYWASHVFVSVATDEAGPVSVMKAMACGVPVVTTPVGATYELMAAHGVGAIVPTRGYLEWVKSIKTILDEGPPQAIDVQTARDSFDWTVVAARVSRIYDELLPSD